MFTNLKLKSDTDISLKTQVKNKTIDADPWLEFAPLNPTTEIKYLPGPVDNSEINTIHQMLPDIIEVTALVDEPVVGHTSEVELKAEEVFDVVLDETSVKQVAVSSEIAPNKQE